MRDWRRITPVVPGEGSNPFWYMTVAQFQLGIRTLQEEAGLILPYGVLPASRPGGFVEAVCTSWARWRTYEWNPPEFMAPTAELLQEFGDTDAAASDKPTWAAIRTACDRAAPGERRRDLLNETRDEARARITAAYAADDWDDEIQRRLAGRNTAEQDAERERLRTRFQTLKRRYEAMSLDDLLAFDPADDAHWK